MASQAQKAVAGSLELGPAEDDLDHLLRSVRRFTARSGLTDGRRRGRRRADGRGCGVGDHAAYVAVPRGEGSELQDRGDRREHQPRAPITHSRLGFSTTDHSHELM